MSKCLPVFAPPAGCLSFLLCHMLRLNKADKCPRMKPETKGRNEMKTPLVAALESVCKATNTEPERTARIIAAAQGEQSDSAEKYLRTGEAAAALECHPRSVFRYAARGLLHPVRRSARAIRWRKSEVERLAGGVAQ